MSIKFKKLNNTIIKCKKCPRLIKFSKKISIVKRKKNITDIYWGKPVPGFGDMNGKLMIIGLAPAAHGGNRTGRPFTGDKSGDFLFKCLHSVNVANQSKSISINDKLKLNDTYITNILKCVPPDDKPLKIELNNCYSYFNNEISQLINLRVILTLGKIAFDNCQIFYNKNYSLKKKLVFKHGKKYHLPDGKILFASYHPSPRNVNTGLINTNKMNKLLKKILQLI